MPRSRTRVAAALLVLTAATSACGDKHWIRRASAAYVVAEAQYEAQCPVKSVCPDWKARKDQLDSEYADINAQITAVEVGKLPKDARERLKVYAGKKPKAPKP